MKNPWQTTIASLAILLASITLSRPARAADESVAAAREVFEKHQGAIVWVTAVMKMRAGVPGFGAQEQKVEALGTVIDETGLTVLSYTALDPTGFLNAAMGRNAGGEDGMKFEFKSELSGVMLRLADGTEIPAKLILKDDDLDLAFVRPTDKKQEIPFLKLPTLDANAGAGETPVKVLDEVIVLSRLGQALDRQPTVTIARVSAVVKKPRTFYVAGDLDALGAPVFTADGRPLGITAIRRQNMDMGLANMMSMASGGGISPVIVPAEDVSEVAQQALAKKGDEKEDEDEKAQDESAEEKSQEAEKEGEDVGDQ